MLNVYLLFTLLMAVIRREKKGKFGLASSRRCGQ